MNELEWLQDFEAKFYKQGGWTIEDLHQEVKDRITILTYTNKVLDTFKVITDSFVPK